MIENIIAYNDTIIGKLIISVIIYGFIFVVGSKLIIHIIDRISKKVDPNSLHWKILRQSVKIIFAIIFIFGVIENVPGMSKLGTTLIACSSVIVAALGLASQDALGNAIDGVFISLFKPFSVGDRIRLLNRGITGRVVDINLRYTSVRTIENNLLLIPNSIMNDEIIENSNIIDTRIHAFLDVEITYQSNVQLAKSILKELVLNHPLYLDVRTEEDIENDVEPVVILVRNLTANGIELRVSVWSDNINDSFSLCSDLREELLVAFDEKGIDIPYQTIEIIHKEL